MSGNFAVVVSCSGVSGYPATLSLNADGTPITAGNLVSGTVCSFSENMLTLPAAPGGYTWVNAQISPASITIASNMTATVTAHNTLAPLPEAPTGVLTVTKTISGTGTGPFNITVTGPSGVISTTTINGGETKLFTGLANGIYTVTESTPAGWTTVYTATPGTVSSVNGIVTLANENTATLASTPISGKVFRDFNSDGQITANGTITDTGVSGVTVTAYDKNGNAVGSATSAADGTYTINPTGAGPYRIEFSSLPAGYEPTTHGTGNGTSVQFIDTAAQASGVNFGLLQPCDYCQNNPRLATTLLSNGDPLMVGSPNATWDALVSMGYGQVSGSVAQLATAAQVGSVWGVAYNNQTQRLYASAMIRRHMGLGANGIGAIYSKPIVGGTPTLFYDFGAVAGTIPTNATRQITTTSASGPTRDTQAFPLVAKAGLGDIDISQDGTRLYAMNLADQKLYYVSTNSPAAGSATAAGTMPWLASNPCTNGTPRPWGIGIDNRGFGERVYAGIVCDASGAGGTAANLTALVYEYNPASNGWTGSPVLSVPLNYTRQTVNGLTATGATVTPETNSNNGWRPWTDSITTMLVDTNTPASDKYYYQQPVLSDIEFDDNGDMILGFFSRTSVQLGWANWLPDAPYGPGGSNTVLGYVSGEILRAGLNSNNALTTWTIEDDGVTTGVNGTRTSTATGSRAVSNPDTSNPTVTSVTAPEPSGLSGANGQEFYWGDLALGVCCGNYVSVHGEASQGALALLPGSGQVVMTEMDAQPASASGTWTLYTRGLHYLSNSTGGRLAGYNMGGDDATFSKAGSMGDLELLCNPAPIEIGNRVWNDLDGDGVQDAGEPALAGVQVQLKQGGAVVAQTTSDANGAYYFNQWESLNTSAQTLTSPINDTRNDARQNATGVANNSDLFFSDRYLGLNFPNLNIPVGATITSATIRFTAADTGTISNVTIKGYANPDAAVWTVGTLPFTGSLSDLYVNNSSSASVTWSNGATWVAGESGINQTTPDLSAIVQEIVNLPTWQRNKTVAFLFQAPTNASGATAYGYSSNAGKGAVLSISFMGTTDGRLQANTAYTIEVPMSQAPIQNNGYNLTTPNAAALTGASVSSNHAISDTRDSDAVSVSGKATIYYTTGSAGQNNHGLDFGFSQPASGQVDILNSAPPVVADPGGFSISKAIATTDGSSPSVSGSFAVVVSCPGVSGYPATLSLNADGTPISVGNLVSGTVCSFSENTLTLPPAPNDYTWVNAQISPSSIIIASNVTATVTATNWLAPVPTPPTHVLTVTKTISGTGSGPFDLTISGPSGYMTTTQIDDGDALTFNVPSAGVYTVTESTPAGWTTVYTATPGTVSSVNGVVTVANQNSTTLAAAPITGKVFRDFNSDGLVTDDGTITDTGVPSVTVTAYDKNGNNVGSVTTASDGTYTINPTGDGPYRVEFTNLPTGYYPTTHGTGNGTSTQFVTTNGGASNVNFGIVDTAFGMGGSDGVQTSMDVGLVTPIYVNGDPANTATPTNALVQIDYDRNAGATASGNVVLATKGEIGATWGLAYDRDAAILYMSAFLKRHVGLKEGSGITNPLGTIFQHDYASGANSLFLDISTLPGVDVGTVANNATRGLGAPTAPNNDPTTLSMIGKVGLGDIDISADGKTLYVMNLFQQKVHAINVTDKSLIASYAFPSPCGASGALRPFALKVFHDQLYAGAICDALTSQVASDLDAYVYRLESGTFQQILTFGLDYPKQPAWDQAAFAGGCVAISGWFAWNDTQRPICTSLFGFDILVYPQPILSDIEFDLNGDMILGFMDRAGHQYGAENYPVTGTTPTMSVIIGGDIVRAPLVNGVYQREALATAAGEYYSGDGTVGVHAESSVGGLALLPGSNEVAVTTIRPFDAVSREGGVRWLNNTTGAKNRTYAIYGDPGLTPIVFGKANGLGDLELIADPAPIEIGNRVWNDLNGNGVQEPGEPGINNVAVNLVNSSGTVISSTVTTGDGSYYFNNLQANTAYTITIDPSDIQLSGFSVTQANMQALAGASVSSNHAISDTRDSDAVLVGGVATIYYTTGSAGQNNHGLDFGFTQPAYGQVDILNTAPVVSLGNRVWYDTNNNGAVDGGEQNVGNGVTVELYQDSDSSGAFSAGDNRLASTVTSGGYYTFTGLTPSSSDATRYLVVITDTNFLAGGLLYGYHNSAGQVTDNSLAADDNKDHGAVSGTLGQNGGVVASSAISLTAGTQPTGEANEGNDPIQSATDANSNQTIDFGFYSLSVGNRVWNDNGAGANADNGQLDSGENGLDGVTVELLNSSNAVVSTTTTSNGGYYTFTGLISGTYRVRISGYLASYRSSTDTVNAAAPTSADDDDNGPGTGTGTLTSSGFALVPGSSANGHSANNATGVTSNPRIDFGLYAAPASFALDKRLVSPVSGVAAVGDPVVYTLVVTNTGAITLTTITLVDSYDANWLQYNSASTAPTAQATGVLTWTLTSPTTPLPLSAGEVMTVTVTFTAVKP